MLTAALLGSLLFQPVNARTTFEKLAAELTSFQASEFIYEREPWRMPKSWAASWRQGLASLRGRAWDEKELIALLKHDSAKVRVLALAALFDRQDPKLLPHFVGLLDDESRHFPEFAVRRAIAQPFSKPPPKDDDAEGDRRPTVLGTKCAGARRGSPSSSPCGTRTDEQSPHEPVTSCFQIGETVPKWLWTRMKSSG